MTTFLPQKCIFIHCVGNSFMPLQSEKSGAFIRLHHTQEKHLFKKKSPELWTISCRFGVFLVLTLKSCVLNNFFLPVIVCNMSSIGY